MKSTIKKLFAALAISIITAALPLNASAASVQNFRDVAPGQWYYTAIDYAVTAGLFGGTSATTFAPNSAMTRGMFVKVLGNKAGINTTEYPSTSFSDVKLGAWYAQGVEWAAQNNIVNGVGGGRFAPDQSVTREQMAVILYNYARFEGCDTMSRVGALLKFTDECKVSSYAYHAMEWAVTNNILCGSGGKLDPQGTATRAQVAQIFYNARELLAGGSSMPDSPTPTPAPVPDIQRIPITDEVRAKLKPNQDPEKLLDYVLNGKHDDPRFPFDGTIAKWDPSLLGASDVGRDYFGSWNDIEDEMRSTAVVANSFVTTLTITASDRFYITAEEADGCFCLVYHPAEKSDSQKMKAVKGTLSLPGSKKFDRGLCYVGSGWAGPISWDTYGGAVGVARKIEYYLCEFHPYTNRYYITELEPGVFYLLYS